MTDVCTLIRGCLWPFVWIYSCKNVHTNIAVVVMDTIVRIIGFKLGFNHEFKNSNHLREKLGSNLD